MSESTSIPKDECPVPYPPLCWFVKSVREGSRLRLRPIGGQWIEDVISPKERLTKVDTSYNVKASSKIREDYPEGTIFAVAELSEAASYYSVPGDTIFPIDDKETDPKYKAAYIEHSARISESILEEEASKDDGSRKKKTLLKSIINTKRYAPPTIEDDGFYVHKDLWYLLVRNMKKHINTMMIGPTGTGKTEILELLGKKMDVDTSVFDMGAMQDAVGSLIGVHRIGKDGTSEFDFSRFVIEAQKAGASVLDEISRAPQMANNILFPALDGRRTIYADLAGAEIERVIPIHPKRTFFATANVGFEYGGTNELDRALKDRFMFVELSPLDKGIESKVVQARTSIPKRTSDLVVAIMDNLRLSKKDGSINLAPSIRESLLIGNLVNDGFPIGMALRNCLLPLYEGDLEEDSDKFIVSTIINKTIGES